MRARYVFRRAVDDASTSTSAIRGDSSAAHLAGGMAARAAPALGDDDPRVVRLGLSAVRRYCPPDIVPLVTRVATDAGASEQLRTLALRALGQSREPQALDTLLAAVNGGTTLLGTPRAPVPTPSVLAALRALTGWWSAPRAQAVLDLAKDAADPTLRQAVSRHLP